MTTTDKVTKEECLPIEVKHLFCASHNSGGFSKTLSVLIGIDEAGNTTTCYELIVEKTKLLSYGVEIYIWESNKFDKALEAYNNA